MAKRASARGIRRDVSGILRAPRRMLVADAVPAHGLRRMDAVDRSCLPAGLHADRLKRYRW